jgi:glycosyltransferase involved in cell wall biosynthesis
MSEISIIIPAYNAQKTIQKTIESVLNQTVQDFEIIVVNDGSTDSTLDAVSQIHDPRIQVFSYPNSGAANTRNQGFEHSSGKYIAFLDADDLWANNKLELQLKALQNNPESAVAYSWTDYIDESGEFLRPGTHVTKNGNVYPALLVQNFLESGSNPLIRREAFAEVGGFDPSLLGGQDTDLYIRLAARYPFIGVPVVQIFYRLSADSITSQVIRHEKQCVAVIEKAFLQAPSSLQYLKPQSLMGLYKYLIFRSFQGYPSPENGRAAIQFLYHYIQYDPAPLKQWRYILVIFCKSSMIALFPPSVTARVLSYLKQQR